MKKIFLVLFILAAFDAFGDDRHKDLFCNPIVQDSLKTFIEKNSYPLSNPYGAPTIYLVTVEQLSPNDTTITFMSSYSMIEEVSLDGKTEPSLYIKGGCLQYGKTVVLFYNNFTSLPEFVDESLLVLERKDYDIFMSNDVIVWDSNFRGVLNIYSYVEGRLKLKRKIGGRTIERPETIDT